MSNYDTFYMYKNNINKK